MDLFALCVVVTQLLSSSSNIISKSIRRIFFSKYVVSGYYLAAYYKTFNIANSLKCGVVSPDRLKQFYPENQDGVAYCLSTLSNSYYLWIASSHMLLFLLEYYILVCH